MRLLEVQLKREPTAAAFEAFMREADTNRDGVMSLHEYIAAKVMDADFRVDGMRPPLQPPSMGLIPAIFQGLVSNGKGGCFIPDTTLRAISIEQLQCLVEHVDSRLDAGEVLAYTPSYPGAPLRTITKCIPMKRKTEDGYEEYTTMDANLYDMDALIIRPATKGRECSLVELMAEGEQPPDYFISHTWAEAVVKFLACVKQHSKVTAASYMCTLSDFAPGPRPREGDG